MEDARMAEEVGEPPRPAERERPVDKDGRRKLERGGRADFTKSHDAAVSVVLSDFLSSFRGPLRDVATSRRAMIRQKIRCTAIGCSQFELLASPVAVRQSLPDRLGSPPSLALVLPPLSASSSLGVLAASPRDPLLCSFLLPVRPRAPSTTPVAPPRGRFARGRPTETEGRAEKTSKKKIQFRYHGDRRALTLIKIPRPCVCTCRGW